MCLLLSCVVASVGAPEVCGKRRDKNARNTIRQTADAHRRLSPSGTPVEKKNSSQIFSDGKLLCGEVQLRFLCRIAAKCPLNKYSVLQKLTCNSGM